MALKDVSGRFTFRAYTAGSFAYKEAKGELGVPGQVVTHRSISAQTSVSYGTGEHAGHLIAIQFGAPGDVRNLGLQNPNMNTFAPKSLQAAFQGAGGSYHDLESRWSACLKNGSRITVTIVDKYRTGQERPFVRSVEWTETTPSGINCATQRLDFGNFSSPQGRLDE